MVQNCMSLYDKYEIIWCSELDASIGVCLPLVLIRHLFGFFFWAIVLCDVEYRRIKSTLALQILQQMEKRVLKSKLHGTIILLDKKKPSRIRWIFPRFPRSIKPWHRLQCHSDQKSPVSHQYHPGKHYPLDVLQRRLIFYDLRLSFQCSIIKQVFSPY